MSESPQTRDPSCSCYSPPTEVTEALNSPLTQKRNVVLSDHVSCPSLTCVSALTGQRQQNLLRGASGESAWEGRYSRRQCAQKKGAAAAVEERVRGLATD